jgi:hypothetical protein
MQHHINPIQKEMKNTETFTDDFLKALSNWQRGWSEKQDQRRIIANELVKQCENLPQNFKTVESFCYRKRFINKGEIIPILINNGFFEGVASWTENSDYAKGFKEIYRPDAKFVMLFKHKPKPEEIVVNIVSLWKNNEFKQAVEKLKEKDEESVKALIHFKDSQSEVILRSTLIGTEIEDIVGISSSFDDLCDRANIPEEEREELLRKYSSDPEGIPIEIPTFAGSSQTKEAIRNTLAQFRESLRNAKKNNFSVDWSRAAKPHKDDLKHKP